MTKNQLVKDKGTIVNASPWAEISDDEVEELVIHKRGKGKEALVDSSDDRSIELEEYEALEQEQTEYEAFSLQESTTVIVDEGVSSDDENYVPTPRRRNLNLEQCDEESSYYSGSDSDEAADVPSDPEAGGDIVLYSDDDEVVCRFDDFDHADFVHSTQNVYEESDVEDRSNVARVPADMLYVGMEWPNQVECREYLRDLAINKHFSLEKIMSNYERQEFKCKDPQCSWRVNCSWTNGKGAFRLKKGQLNHSCKPLGLLNPMANTRWVANKLMGYMMYHIQCKPSTIKNRMKRKHRVQISYWTAWHARHICLERIFGSYEKSYGQVPELCRQIQLANPGSIATWSKDTTHGQFEGLFVMFKASLDGFLHGCRSIIGLDGTFLKGKYGGMVLSAMGLDNGNGIFPIAIYICRNECKDTWNKFLGILAPHVSRHEQPLTFISDQQKGIIDGVARQFVMFNYHHRLCFRHLYKNFKKKFPGSHLQTLVWRAAKSYNEVDYKHWMKEVAQHNPPAVTWLEAHPLEEWTRCKFDHTSHCEHVSNNFSESFNSWIIELRHLPICKFVMEYLKLVMETLYNREQKGLTWCQTGLIKRAEDRLEGHRLHVHFFYTYPSTSTVWLVENKIDMTWIVDLTKRECNCGAWKVCGVPCVHAMAVILEKREDVYSYVDPCHYVDKYMLTYAGSVQPLADPVTWLPVEDIYKVYPPKVVKLAGRPRTQRRRDRDEADGQSRSKKQCGICKLFGHNRTGCKGATDGDPSTIGVNIIHGPHVRRKQRENASIGAGTSAPQGIATSSRPQRANAGVRTTRFGIIDRGDTIGGILRGGIPPMAVVRGRGGRGGPSGAVRGRGGRGGPSGAVRGRGGRAGPSGDVRGRGGRAGPSGAGTSAVVRGGRTGPSGAGASGAGASGAGTQSSQTSTITHTTTTTQRGRGYGSVAGHTRIRGGGTGLANFYPVENMNRRSASLMRLTEDQPPAKRGKQPINVKVVKWY